MNRHHAKYLQELHIIRKYVECFDFISEQITNIALDGKRYVSIFFDRRFDLTTYEV